MQWLELKLPPLLLVALIALGMWALPRELPSVTLSETLRLIVAGALAIAGIGSSVAGKIQFGRAGTTVNPLTPDRASALVTSGIYRHTRNPMYIGFLLVLLGWAVYLGSFWALAGPVAFVLYMSRFQIMPEERALSALFGEEYRAYCARVRRWL